MSIQPDGSATVMVIGLIGNLHIPGQGLIAHQSGKLVLFFTDPTDQQPDVIFEAGPKDDLEAALAP